MICSYSQITPKLAKKIKLVMTDVDDTLTSKDGSFCASVREAVQLLTDQGIIVGLNSGRTMGSLISCAKDLGINGPIIAENGGQVKLHAETATLNFGHQEIVIKALSPLKNKFGTAIRDGEWNNDRVTDLIIGCEGINIEKLQVYLDTADVIETGNFYENSNILHLSAKGVNKGNTLRSILKELDHGEISQRNTLVIGDGPNDLPMFHLFPCSILIPNPSQPVKHRKTLQEAARYSGNVPGGEGFAGAVKHLSNMRLKAETE